MRTRIKSIQHLSVPMPSARISTDIEHHVRITLITGFQWCSKSYHKFHGPMQTHAVLSRVLSLGIRALIGLSGVAFFTYNMLVIADDFRYVFRACQPPQNRTSPLAVRSH